MNAHACNRACAAVILRLPSSGPLALFRRSRSRVTAEARALRETRRPLPHPSQHHYRNMTCQRTSPRKHIDCIRRTAFEHRLPIMPG